MNAGINFEVSRH